ncbi:MAG: tRNA lysidine(34) synthetase TilS [Ruminococcaceae bacterium]|nr:tRNA lysidine(34) synthetase TilS [Oscillospiraceae bacterium]
MKKDIFDGFAPPHTLSQLSPDTPILVGFSGGADSRFLLHLLSEYSKKHGTPICAAHLNHGIRGEEADRDESFCRQVAAEYGIPFFCERADIPSISKQTGESLELMARVCRYEFFKRIMQENSIPLLATAHNADDVLETVLFRLMRGTGTRGLSAIPPLRKLGGGHLAVRPILAYTKREIIGLCDALGLEYVTDSTNFEDDCTRNRIRHAVIPELEKISGGGIPQRAAVRYSSFAREDEDALMCLAEAALNTSDPLRISVDKLNSLHRAVAKRVIFKLYANLFSDSGGDIPEDKTLSNLHVEAVLELASKGVKHSRLDLPDGNTAVIENGCLVFSKQNDTKTDNTFFVQEVNAGHTRINHRFSVAIEHIDKPSTHKKGMALYDGQVFASVAFPADGISPPLTVRPRESGDVIRSHSMTKKLKKLLCDKNISLELRDALPLFILPDGAVLWCPSVAIADGFKADTGAPAVRLTVIIHDV